MTHPTELRLLSWHDGEVDPPDREEIQAHVATCARCQQTLHAVEQVRHALQVWADEVSPAPAEDFTDRILRAVETNTAPHHHGHPPTPSLPLPTNGPGNVQSLQAHRRRRWWYTAPMAIAAAAAAVMAIGTRFPKPGSRHAPSPPVAVRKNTPAPSPTASETPVATLDLGGSTVLAVDVEGEHTSYSVMEIEGNREGSTIAVVWIDDSP